MTAITNQSKPYDLEVGVSTNSDFYNVEKYPCHMLENILAAAKNLN